MQKDTFIGKRARALEDAFFIREDRKLIEKLELLKKTEETKKRLAEISGITDGALLDKLIELKIHPEILASLSLVPLVEVAWADGEVDADERRAILKASTKTGMTQGSVDYELLERWLVHRPDAALLNAWEQYIQTLCGHFSPAERASLKKELIHRARLVAEASGGFLGIGSISDAEEAMLKKMESAFG